MSKTAQFDALHYAWVLGRSCETVEQYRDKISDTIMRLSREDIDFVAERKELELSVMI